MTLADVVAYHRQYADSCREAAASAQAGFQHGCEDAGFVAEGWRESAREHDQMATVLEVTAAQWSRP